MQPARLIGPARPVINLLGLVNARRAERPEQPSRSQRVIFTAIAGDLAVATGKFVAAAFTGSSVMLVEGFHSLVDTGNELLLLIGLKRSHRAADDAHAFGYGKVSYFWSLIVALSIFSLGGGISVYQGIVSLHRPPVLENSAWNYFVLGIAALFESYSWRVSHAELARRRGPGDSLWQTVHKSKDAAVFTVFLEDSASLIGIVIAALGVGLSHALDNRYFDPAASVLIGLVLFGTAFLLARESGALLVGESIDGEQIEQLRRIIACDPAVESVRHLLTMQLGPESVLLTAAVRFKRRLSLDEVEQAIARLERSIKAPFPAIQHLFLESGALKSLSQSARYQAASEPL